MQAVKHFILSFKVDCTRNAGATVATSPVPAMVSAGLETIAVAKGPTGLMVAVTERLEEQAAMSVLKSQLRNSSWVNKFCWCSQPLNAFCLVYHYDYCPFYVYCYAS